MLVTPTMKLLSLLLLFPAVIIMFMLMSILARAVRLLLSFKYE